LINAYFLTLAALDRREAGIGSEMPRPPLPIGTRGRISTSVEKSDERGKAVSYRVKSRSAVSRREHQPQRPAVAVGDVMDLEGHPPLAADRVIRRLWIAAAMTRIP
jgi:hypothetical protein